jgi:hypothetical protein
MFNRSTPSHEPIIVQAKTEPARANTPRERTQLGSFGGSFRQTFTPDRLTAERSAA